jgi:hypothetical protein
MKPNSMPLGTPKTRFSGLSLTFLAKIIDHAIGML